MPTNILILNIHSDRNAGDYALSRVTVQQLQNNFPDCKITLCMNDPQSYQGDLNALGSFFTWVLEEEKWHWNRLIWLGPATILPIVASRFFRKPWFGFTPKYMVPLLRAYIDADLVISTSGGFYRSSGKGLTLLITTYSLVLALLAKKPLYIFPQTIGPFHFRWEFPLARWIYSRARIVMAREPISVENLITCGIPKNKCVLLPDVAFGFEGASSEAARRWLSSQGLDPESDTPLMGMTVINWAASSPNFKRQQIYEQAIDAVIRTFVELYHGKVLLLPQTWGPTSADDDRITAQRVIRRLPEIEASIIAVNEPIAPDLLQAVFGEMDLVIGTRMHSNIFSISRGVPVIPIGYLHKTLGIAEMAGLDQWVIDIEQVNAENLKKKLTELWIQREEISAGLKQRIPELIKESQNAGVLVARDFAHLSERPSDD